jgi:hypothetical protein
MVGQLTFTRERLSVHLHLSRLGNVRRAQVVASRCVVAFLALQVLSGWVILFAIGWCLLEIVRAPAARPRRRTRRARNEPVAVWLELEHAPSRRRCLAGAAEHAALGLRVA